MSALEKIKLFHQVSALEKIKYDFTRCQQLKKSNNIIPLGVSTYVPYPGEDLLFTYRSYDNVREAHEPACPEHITITYSVLYDGPDDANKRNMSIEMHTYAVPFFNIMQEAANINANFR